jgi:hypothetical protein
MKKVQVPVMGGFRKVIYPGAGQSVGTTIAEVGSGVITLAQLAAAINNILTGTGTTTTGSAQAANLVVGPGLAGGGTLVGNVPLRLTAPIPWFGDAEQGDEGERGPPGIQGPRGLQGIPGQFLMPEDGQDGDWGPPGAAGAVGATGPQGPQGPQGPAGTGTGSGGTGTLMMFVPEDASYDDLLPIPGPAGAVGPQGPAGSGTLAMFIPEDPNFEDMPPSAGPWVPVMAPNIIGPMSVSALNGSIIAVATATSAANPAVTVNGTFGAEALQVNGSYPTTGIGVNSISTGQNFLQVATTTTAHAVGLQFGWGNLVNPQGFYGITPGGGVFITGDAAGDLCFVNRSGRALLSLNNGTTAHFVLTTQSLITNGFVGAKSATPAVTAGQTDIGTTTTATVITTAGGIALPALAVTFWVVNVSGVKYGVPCFAL